ncbi:hypothetical protein, partial [Paenibacillus sp.]|uniref:hypothetical protein n=1 Tax=Paenibacillus sp. TaxID=58172 RepID=UPI002916304F
KPDLLAQTQIDDGRGIFIHADHPSTSVLPIVCQARRGFTLDEHFAAAKKAWGDASASDPHA